MKDDCFLSVVMVSDFEPTDTKSWKDELALVHALAQQDVQEQFEVLLIESEESRDQEVPSSLYEMIPGLSVHYFDSVKSADLKDYGVRLARGKYVAVLESDCVPTRDWLRALLGAMSRNDWDIVSGRTFYGNESTYKRVMNLLHRSWFDHGRSCPTTYISNNGAIYRREVLQQFPYPNSATPFVSAEIRNGKIQQAGYRSYYEREALMKHAIGGISFVWDLQRNKGHQSMTSAPHQAYSQIPRLLGAKVKSNIKNCGRLGSEYLRWYDWPALIFFMFAELVPFSVGMVEAVNKVEVLSGSAYR